MIISKNNIAPEKPSFLKNYSVLAILLTTFSFLIFLFVNIYKDYGISWDEPLQRQLGAVNVKYVMDRLFFGFDHEVLNSAPKLLSYMDRQYGPFFESLLLSIELLVGSDTTQKIYYLRHLCNALTFLCGVAGIFYLSYGRFGSAKMAFFTALMYLVSPRFFAEGFYNSKDIIFATFFIFSVISLIKFIKEPSLNNSLIHALLTAILIDIRIMGILVLAATLLFFSISNLSKNYAPAVKNYLIIYIVASLFLTIIFFPFLWSDPIGHFFSSFSRMAHFDWDGFNLYMGELVHAYQLPWHYIPVWIFISTPFLYSFLFIFGLLSIFIQLFNKPLKKIAASNRGLLIDLIFGFFFLIPILAVVLMGSTLYNGWRQVYFVYPFFILIATCGLNEILIRLKSLSKFIFLTIFYISIITTTIWMIKWHPFQFVYFNSLYSLLSKTNLHYFDHDYWGVSAYDAIRYILDNDTSLEIKIIGEPGANPLANNLMLLSESEKKRISLVKNLTENSYVIKTKSDLPMNCVANKSYSNKPMEKYFVRMIDGYPIYVICKVTPL
jgi:hypothetical protein